MSLGNLSNQLHFCCTEWGSFIGHDEFLDACAVTKPAAL